MARCAPALAQRRPWRGRDGSIQYVTHDQRSVLSLFTPRSTSSPGALQETPTVPLPRFVERARTVATNPFATSGSQRTAPAPAPLAPKATAPAVQVAPQQLPVVDSAAPAPQPAAAAVTPGPNNAADAVAPTAPGPTLVVDTPVAAPTTNAPVAAPTTSVPANAPINTTAINVASTPAPAAADAAPAPAPIDMAAIAEVSCCTKRLSW